MIFDDMKNEELIDRLIDLAIEEDISSGDISTDAIIPVNSMATAVMTAKADGVISGLSVIRKVYGRFEDDFGWKPYVKDGDSVRKGDRILEIKASYRTLLYGERLSLNILQRMSGIATATSRFVAEIEGTGTTILDTRKTAPGMRVLDKMAVKFGGGENHRMGLFDMILLKDNHIDFAGGIQKAIRGVREYLKARGKELPIECEVRSLEDIDEVFAAGGVDRIMFDNFTPEMTRRAVEKVAGRCETESSGGITLETIREYAECGVDFISVGALTHQIRSLDMSLKACE